MITREQPRKIVWRFDIDHLKRMDATNGVFKVKIGMNMND